MRRSSNAETINADSRQSSQEHGALNASENDIAGVELMLYLIRASDVIREEIYGALRRDAGLTEGKFALLMILL